MKVKPYSANQLGSESHMIMAAQGGVQEMVHPVLGPGPFRRQGFAFLDQPFLFADERESDAVLDGPVGKKLLDNLSDAKPGLHQHVQHTLGANAVPMAFTERYSALETRRSTRRRTPTRSSIRTRSVRCKNT